MARSSSRFNKFLNFIGLVDEPDDRGVDYEPNRPSGAATYNPPARRNQSNARPVRGQDQDYEDARYGQQRYDGRQDYSSRDYQGRDYNARYAGGNDSRYYNDPYNAGKDYSPAHYSDVSREYTNSRFGGNRSSSRNADYEQRTPARAEYDQPRTSSGRSQQADARRQNDYYAQRAGNAPARQQDARAQQEAYRPDNVYNIHAGERGMQSQTVIFYLHALEECRDVITALLDNKTVLLNLEDMDERLIQRAIDTLCGAAFALNATLRKASDKTYLIAPNSVNVFSREEARY